MYPASSNLAEISEFDETESLKRRCELDTTVFPGFMMLMIYGANDMKRLLLLMT